MDMVVWNLLTAIATVATTSIVVANYINNRFNRSELKDARIDGAMDSLLLQINGNREAIEHTRERFFHELAQYGELDKERGDRIDKNVEILAANTSAQFEKLNRRVRDLENYVAKDGFVVRQ